ncbi:hypothetical protein ALC60_04176, partial [Trachymyrmex zeteki]
IARVDPKAKREPPLVDVRLKAATGRYRNVPRLGLKANQSESQRTLILGESSRFCLLISIKLRTYEYGNAESIDAVLVVNPECHFASKKNLFYAAAAGKKSPNFVSYLSLTWLSEKKNSPFLKGSRPRVSKRDSTIPLRAVSCVDCCGNIKLRESPWSTLQSSELPQVTWDEPTINRKSSVYTE